MKRLIFEGSKGYFGEDGYVQISFWRWLWMLLDGRYVIRSRWGTKESIRRARTSCEILKCNDYINGKCYYKGICKYR